MSDYITAAQAASGMGWAILAISLWFFGLLAGVLKISYLFHDYEVPALFYLFAYLIVTAVGFIVLGGMYAS